MSETSKRSTVYFDPKLHAALRLKAAHTHRSLSDIVNDAVRAALAEDQEDLAAFEERVSVIWQQFSGRLFKRLLVASIHSPLDSYSRC